MPIKSVYDRARLSDLLLGQFGVVSRSQALDCGLSRGRMDHLTQPGGRWQRILSGVYAATTGTVTPDQRAMAALLYAGPGSLITGAAAVRRYNLRCAGLNEIDVLVRVGVRRQSAEFVRIIHTSRMPQKCHSTGELRFAALARAVADAARGMTRLSDVRAVVAEAIQHGRCDLVSLITELNEGPVAGSRFYRAALAEISEGIRSAAEADMKALIDKSDLEKPMYNAELHAADGSFLGIADAWWQRAGVAAEVDSRQYHLGPEDYERTVMRHNRMEAHGINLLHFLPSTLKRKSPTVVADLRGAIESGNSAPPLPIVAIPAHALGGPHPKGANLSIAQLTPIEQVDCAIDRSAQPFSGDNSKKRGCRSAWLGHREAGGVCSGVFVVGRDEASQGR
jgi:hypothetical protein